MNLDWHQAPTHDFWDHKPEKLGVYSFQALDFQ
jgi:hypothetical protein